MYTFVFSFGSFFSEMICCLFVPWFCPWSWDSGRYRRLHTAKDFPMSNGNPCDVNYDEDISAAASSQDIRQSVTIKL